MSKTKRTQPMNPIRKNENAQPSSDSGGCSYRDSAEEIVSMFMVKGRIDGPQTFEKAVKDVEKVIAKANDVAVDDSTLRMAFDIPEGCGADIQYMAVLSGAFHQFKEMTSEREFQASLDWFLSYVKQHRSS